MSKPRRKLEIWPKLFPYAVLALGGFICALMLVVLLLWKKDVLIQLGLVGRFFYLILLPLGLSCAAFLFGALRSFAIYKGKHVGGALELGGPIVGFGLVVVGGFGLPPPELSFTATVYVHDEISRGEIPLRSVGIVTIDIGGERKEAEIGAKGEAVFLQIPPAYLGESVNIGVQRVPYEIAPPGPRRLGPAVYLGVRRKPVRITGSVRDENGDTVASATVSASGVSVKSNSTGYFELVLPSPKANGNQTLLVTAPGFKIWSLQLADGYGTSPSDPPIGVMLSRVRE